METELSSGRAFHVSSKLHLYPIYCVRPIHSIIGWDITYSVAGGEFPSKIVVEAWTGNSENTGSNPQAGFSGQNYPCFFIHVSQGELVF